MRVTRSVLLSGKADWVFDLVTTAKYWPQWHPATIRVSGAIENPMRLGDVIRERARIAGMEAEGDWTVAEIERPTRVVLKMPATRLGDLQISYQFAPRGDEIEFTRELEFDASRLPALVPASLVERQMDSDSVEALKRLKVLIDRLGAHE